MKLSIPAWSDNEYIGLENILRSVKRLLNKHTWRLNVLEAAPEPGGEKLTDVNPESPMNFSDLLALVTPNLQIIDGEAIATDENNPNEKVIIRAVDSTFWDLETDRGDVISVIMLAFPSASLIEE